jgi:hypothetical protein
MRLAVLLLSLTIPACAGRSNFRPPPLPELVATVRPIAPLVASDLRMIGGERLIWDIQAKGFSVARAEMTVGDDTVTSRVETGMLASTVTSLRHELATTLDREHVRTRTMRETLALDGKTTTTDALFDSKGYIVDGKVSVAPGVQSIHSALGMLRDWVAPDAHAGLLPIFVGGVVYRLEVAQPTLTEVSGTSAYKVDCRIAGLGTVTLWLSTTDDHVPIRFEVSTAEGKLAAELIERTAK